MSRAVLVLAGRTERDTAHRWIDRAPVNSRVTFQGPKRSLAQNDLFWSYLTDVATQYRHQGQRLTPDDYRLLFLDALKREVRMVPALDGRGWVSLGRSSSDLSREEFNDLLTLIEAWAAQNGVTLTKGRNAVEAA